MGGEKRAWYTLFVQAQFPRISGNLEISEKSVRLFTGIIHVSVLSSYVNAMAHD